MSSHIGLEVKFTLNTFHFFCRLFQRQSYNFMDEWTRCTACCFGSAKRQLQSLHRCQFVPPSLYARLHQHPRRLLRIFGFCSIRSVCTFRLLVVYAFQQFEFKYEQFTSDVLTCFVVSQCVLRTHLETFLRFQFLSDCHRTRVLRLLRLSPRQELLTRCDLAISDVCYTGERVSYRIRDGQGLTD